ncbi:CBS domain-containing protein [Metallosphaera tengchongensis]|uniref:CBS domain-containing protein n=1 Tax=Metallosphaera tengchongensis TaxID=1532350 RepID=A0A6N0NUV2_9CREN|nr:CBS domain-containing protein [Metallosphaera tengchongensis]QKR00566.1 CBS domain-containing protein [Metallosphaera tengchongensis]
MSHSNYIRVTKPFIVEEGTKVSDLVRELKGRGIDIVLVVRKGTPIGWLSTKNLDSPERLSCEVQEIMNRNIITVNGNEDLLDVLSLMIKNKLDCLLLMKRGKVEGVITVKDVLYAIQKNAETVSSQTS